MPGATCSRTCSQRISDTPNNHSAQAIAKPEYRLRGATPRGTTVIVAPHHRHRYRRTISTTSKQGPSGSSTPHSCLSRSPWPTSPTGPPTGWPAAPQQEQCDGLAISTGGILLSQKLTSIDECTTCKGLRFRNNDSGARRESRGQTSLPSPILWPTNCRCSSSDRPQSGSLSHRANSVHTHRSGYSRATGQPNPAPRIK